MLIPRKMKESKRLILGLILLFALLGIGYLIYSNFLTLPVKSIEPITGLNLDMSKVTNSQFSSDFAIDFLTKLPYKDLRLPNQANLPIIVNRIGRVDPFAKISFYLLDLKSEAAGETGGESEQTINEAGRVVR